MRHEFAISILTNLEKDEAAIVADTVSRLAEHTRRLTEIRASLATLIRERESADDESSISKTSMQKKEAIDPIADAIAAIGRFADKYEIMKITGPLMGISSALSKAKKLGKRDIASYTPSGAQKHTLWGFSFWMGDDDKPKPEYMPVDKEEVVDQKKITEVSEDGYKGGLTKSAKAEYALKKIGKLSSASDIIKTLLVRDFELIKRNNTTVSEYQKGLASILLQKALAEDVFYIEKSEDGHVKYGLLAWKQDWLSEYYDEEYHNKIMMGDIKSPN